MDFKFAYYEDVITENDLQIQGSPNTNSKHFFFLVEVDKVS